MAWVSSVFRLESDFSFCQWSLSRSASMSHASKVIFRWIHILRTSSRRILLLSFLWMWKRFLHKLIKYRWSFLWLLLRWIFLGFSPDLVRWVRMIFNRLFWYSRTFIKLLFCWGKLLQQRVLIVRPCSLIIFIPHESFLDLVELRVCSRFILLLLLFSLLLNDFKDVTWNLHCLFWILLSQAILSLLLFLLRC